MYDSKYQSWHWSSNILCWVRTKEWWMCSYKNFITFFYLKTTDVRYHISSSCIKVFVRDLELMCVWYYHYSCYCFIWSSYLNLILPMMHVRLMEVIIILTVNTTLGLIKGSQTFYIFFKIYLVGSNNSDHDFWETE